MTAANVRLTANRGRARAQRRSRALSPLRMRSDRAGQWDPALPSDIARRSGRKTEGTFVKSRATKCHLLHTAKRSSSGARARTQVPLARCLREKMLSRATRHTMGRDCSFFVFTFTIVLPHPCPSFTGDIIPLHVTDTGERPAYTANRKISMGASFLTSPLSYYSLFTSFVYVPFVECEVSVLGSEKHQ